LICSSVNEMISAILKARAKFLEEGINQLLGDKALKEQLYSHPLIQCLGRDVNPILKKLGGKDLPAYIPARNFALAIMDLIKPGIGARDALAPSPTVLAATGSASIPGTATDLLAELTQKPSPIPPSLQRALIALVQAGGGDAARTRQNIEDWYNSVMDRVSGAYKRRTQYAIFAIGLVVTVCVNGDSVVVFKRLTADKTLAAAVADSAEQYTKANRTAQSGSASATPEESPKSVEPDIEKAKRNLKDKLDTLDRLGLPIGWDGHDESCTAPSWPGWAKLNAIWPKSRKLLIMHWAGWLLTAFAVSFGAPFWFDLLNRFMVVRSTVKPKEKSPEEGSKD
jgi:hypothetical protein